MHNLDGFLDLPTVGANGRLSTLNFGGGSAAPPKPPKIKAPEPPKFDFPKYEAPALPPVQPPAPVQVTTADNTSAGDDARSAALRRKGIRSTLFAGAVNNSGAAQGLGSTLVNGGQSSSKLG